MDSSLSTVVTLASGFGKKNSKKYLLTLLDRELSLTSLGTGKTQPLDLSTLRTSPGPPDGNGTSFSVCVVGSGKKMKLITLTPDDDTSGWSQVVLIMNAKKARQVPGLLVAEDQKRKKRRKSVSAIASKLRGVPERKEVDNFDEQDVERLSVKVVIDGSKSKEVVIGNAVRTGAVVQSVLDREGGDVLDYLLRSKGGTELSLNASLGTADSPSVIFLTPRPPKDDDGSTDDENEQSPPPIFQLITIRFADEDLTRKVVAQQPTKLKVLLKQLLVRTGQSYRTYTVTQDGARIDYNKLVGEDSTPMEFTLSRLAPVALPPAEVSRICITIEDAKRTVAVPQLVPLKEVLQEVLDRSGGNLSDYLVLLEDGREHNLDRVVGLPDSPGEITLVEKSKDLALDFDFLDPTGNEWIVNVLTDGVNISQLFQRPVLDEEEAVNFLYQESTKFVADYEGGEVKYVDDHSVLIRTLFGMSMLKYDGDMPIKEMFLNLFDKAALSYKVRVGEYLDKMDLRLEEFQTAWDHLTAPATGDEASSISLLQLAEELKAQNFEVSELIDESFLPDRRADKLRYTREEPKSKIFGFMKKKENYLTSDVPVPIVDLSRVVDASGNFSMKFFVAVFSAQFSVNFSKFKYLMVPRLLKGLGHGVKLLHGSLDPTIFQDFEVLGRDYDDRLKTFSGKLQSTAEKFLLLLQDAKSRHFWCQETVLKYSMTELADKASPSRYAFIDRKLDELKSIFSGHEFRSFPISCPDINRFNEQNLQITSAKMYYAAREEWELLYVSHQRYKALHTLEMPIHIPNFSTPDGLPLLPIADIGMLKTVSASYCLYSTTLSNLCRQWTVGLRILYNLDKIITEPYQKKTHSGPSTPNPKAAVKDKVKDKKKQSS